MTLKAFIMLQRKSFHSNAKLKYFTYHDPNQAYCTLSDMEYVVEITSSGSPYYKATTWHPYHFFCSL